MHGTRHTPVRKVKVVTLWELRNAVGRQHGAGRPHSAPIMSLVELGAFLGTTIKLHANLTRLVVLGWEQSSRSTNEQELGEEHSGTSDSIQDAHAMPSYFPYSIFRGHFAAGMQQC